MIALRTLLNEAIAQHGQVIGIVSSRDHFEELEFASLACIMTRGSVDGQDFDGKIFVTRSDVGVSRNIQKAGLVLTRVARPGQAMRTKTRPHRVYEEFCNGQRGGWH